MIRIAEEKDAEALLDIYGYYVENTAITFEYITPSIEEFQERIRTTLEKYPYLVYEEAGKILGYAYVGAFNKRAAARWMVETSIYVKNDVLNKGIGRLLYEELEKILKKQNILKLIACITDSEKEDSYVPKKSVLFHQHMGYKMAGKIKKGGYKFGNWYDLAYMEKEIGEFTKEPEEVVLFSKMPYQENRVISKNNTSMRKIDD